MMYCFAWFLDDAPPANKSRAALWRGAKWPEQSTISISFLMGDASLGDASLCRRVQAAAEQWIAPGLANLTFQFRDDTNDTDIRIAFVPGAGSWSRIGTTCHQVSKDKATMNFGWLTPASTTLEIEAVVLHEFGHALGLIHEHQTPTGGIHWKRDIIYAELGAPPNSWSKQTVDLNLFQPWEAGETNFTTVDPTSIMMYPIPARWTTDGFTTGLNAKLSNVDREFITQQYP
jgi:serralysin